MLHEQIYLLHNSKYQHDTKFTVSLFHNQIKHFTDLENLFIHSIKSNIMKALILQHQSLLKTASLLFSVYMLITVVLIVLF
jgi:hypothetical protein